MSKQNKITVEAFAGLGKVKNRRNQPVTASYIYRLIRQHNSKERATVPFKYVMEGDKDRIWIVLN